MDRYWLVHESWLSYFTGIICFFHEKIEQKKENKIQLKGKKMEFNNHRKVLFSE